jgi:hypothetical protein
MKSGLAKIDNIIQPTTIARGLVSGGSTLYVFQLTGTSKNGAVSTGLDSVIYVPNQSPIAVTGPPIIDSTSTTAVLSGSNSTDPEGLPLIYSWGQTSGPNSAVISTPTMANPIASGLINGVYIFQLSVKDSGGLISSASQIVTVNIAAPKPVTIIKVVTVTTVTTSDGVLRVNPYM